jgi:hypothetical protein
MKRSDGIGRRYRFAFAAHRATGREAPDTVAGKQGEDSGFVEMVSLRRERTENQANVRRGFGHKNPSTTMQYMQFTREEMQEALDER